jgi:hypothetical protein
VEKVFLVSAVPLAVLLAAWLAQDDRTSRALRRGVYALTLLFAAYGFGLIYVLPRL